MHTIKITPNLLFEYQWTSGKFIRLPNRKNRFVSENRIKTFLPELECSSPHKCRQIRTNNTLRVTDTSKKWTSAQRSDVSFDIRAVKFPHHKCWSLNLRFLENLSSLYRCGFTLISILFTAEVRALLCLSVLFNIFDSVVLQSIICSCREINNNSNMLSISCGRMRSRVYVTVQCPSHSPAAVACGGFAAVGPAGRRYWSTAARPAPHTMSPTYIQRHGVTALHAMT